MPCAARAVPASPLRGQCFDPCHRAGRLDSVRGSETLRWGGWRATLYCGRLSFCGWLGGGDLVTVRHPRSSFCAGRRSKARPERSLILRGRYRFQQAQRLAAKTDGVGALRASLGFILPRPLIWAQLTRPPASQRAGAAALDHWRVGPGGRRALPPCCWSAPRNRSPRVRDPDKGPQ